MRNFQLANCIQRNENPSDESFSIIQIEVWSNIFLKSIYNPQAVSKNKPITFSRK